jgi:hypothetical protein
MDQVAVVLTMEPMTEAEAMAFGVPPDERHRYVRLVQRKGPDHPNA